MTTVTWTVEVDADPDTTGQFIIGSSLLGGSDTVAPDERWIEVSGGYRKVRHISIRRGGSDGIRPYNAGECVVEFDNRGGDFDPDNPYGYYVMGPLRLLTQGTGLRVKANANTAATVYRGFVEEPRNSDDIVAPTATYTCTDLLAELGKIDVPFQSSETGTGEASSDRAGWLLDQANVPASLRSVAAAGRACLGTTGGGKVREALERVAAGEAGRFFVDREGTVVLTWHDAEYGKTSQADFTDDTTGVRYALLETSPGIVGITNAATVHRVVPQVRNEETGQFEAGPELDDVGAADWDSIALYRRRDVNVDVVLQDDADAESLATFLATRRSQPTPRVAAMVVVPLERLTAVQAQAVLEADLGDLITVVRHTVDGRMNTYTANIENISIDANPSAKTTRVTFVTSPSDTAGIFGGTGWFIIGDSLLGGSDVLAPY